MVRGGFGIRRRHFRSDCGEVACLARGRVRLLTDWLVSPRCWAESGWLPRRRATSASRGGRSCGAELSSAGRDKDGVSQTPSSNCNCYTTLTRSSRLTSSSRYPTWVWMLCRSSAFTLGKSFSWGLASDRRASMKGVIHRTHGATLSHVRPGGDKPSVSCRITEHAADVQARKSNSPETLWTTSNVEKWQKAAAARTL